MTLKDYSTSELLNELRNRDDVWAVKVWTRDDVEGWLNVNLESFDNDEKTLWNQREDIIRSALGSTANLDDACETDWATIDCYMTDLLRSEFNAHMIH